MKRTPLISAFMFISILGCTKDDMNYASNVQSTKTGTASPVPKAAMRYTGTNYSQPITVAQANLMIESYLKSIDYENNDSTIRSFTFDADTLRAYLANNDIKTIKLMFAHKKSYLDAGNTNVKCDMKASSLTMVIVGLDNDDDYILNAQNMVYDNMLPCPANCPNNSNTIIP